MRDFEIWGVFSKCAAVHGFKVKFPLYFFYIGVGKFWFKFDNKLMRFQEKRIMEIFGHREQQANNLQML